MTDYKNVYLIFISAALLIILLILGFICFQLIESVVDMVILKMSGYGTIQRN